MPQGQEIIAPWGLHKPHVLAGHMFLIPTAVPNRVPVDLTEMLWLRTVVRYERPSGMAVSYMIRSLAHGHFANHAFYTLNQALHTCVPNW